VAQPKAIDVVVVRGVSEKRQLGLLHWLMRSVRLRRRFHRERKEQAAHGLGTGTVLFNEITSIGDGNTEQPLGLSGPEEGTRGEDVHSLRQHLTPRGLGEDSGEHVKDSHLDALVRPLEVSGKEVPALAVSDICTVCQQERKHLPFLKGSAAAQSCGVDGRDLTECGCSGGDEEDCSYPVLTEEQRRSKKFFETVVELEKYEEELNQDVPLTTKWVLSRWTDVFEASDSPRGWTNSVNAMKHSRELREIYLMSLGFASRIKDVEKRAKVVKETEGHLDEIDELEKKALSDLYGAFRYLSGLSGYPTSELFSKSECDEEMENFFGTLEFEVTEDPSKRHARDLFTNYLCRKVWVASPWRKLQKSVPDFLERTCNNPIKEPVDNKAVWIARRVLDLIMIDEDFEDFKKRTYVPEASCLENSKGLGGKRFFLRIGGRRFKKRYVVPVSIYTGGKIRTITKDSADHVKHNWIVKYLNHCFSKLTCAIFGGDVSEWAERNRSILKKRAPGFYVSGDLESATDNFDGRITDSLIDLFCERNQYDFAQELKNFTTQCTFKVGSGKESRFYKQSRGQMMGSVISFPFLCVLSLSAVLYGLDDDVRQWVLKDKKNLLSFRGVGINGDDVVFREEAGIGLTAENWERGVRSIGGIVSRGKTIKNRHYFTVNSELWDGDSVERVNVLRPSLLTALTGDNRYFINPQREWKEFRERMGEKDPLVRPEAERVWNLTDKLKLGIPVSLGGLGLVSLPEGEGRRKALEAAWLETENAKRNRLPTIGFAAYELGVRNLNADPMLQGPRVNCFLKRDSLAAFRRIYEKLEGGWQMSVQEMKLICRAFINPHAHSMFPLVVDAVRSTPGLIERITSWKYEKISRVPACIDDLYHDLMQGWVPARLPEALLHSLALDPRMIPEQLESYYADREAEEDHRTFDDFAFDYGLKKV